MAVEIKISNAFVEFTKCPIGHVVSSGSMKYLLSFDSVDIDKVVTWTLLENGGGLMSYRHTKEESINILNANKYVDLGRIFVNVE